MTHGPASPFRCSDGGRRPHSRLCLLTRPGIGLVLVLVGCAPSEPPPPPTAFVLELIDSTGCIDCPGGEALGSVRDVSLGPNGTLAILTREQPHVRIVTDAPGDMVTVGASGRGPGEVANAQGIAVLRDGRVVVAGLETTLFSPSGAPLARLPNEGTVLTLFIDSSPSGEWVLALERDAGLGRSVRLVVLDSELRRAAEPFVVPDDWAEIPGLLTGVEIGHAVSDDGSIAYGTGHGDYAVSVLNPSGGIVEGGRDIERTRRTEAERAALQAQIEAVVGGPARPVSEQLAHFGAASFRFDGQGRLWVRTPRGKEGPTVFDVFSGELEYLGEVHAQERIAGPWDLGYDRLAGVVHGDLDVPFVKVWRIREPESPEP